MTQSPEAAAPPARVPWPPILISATILAGLALDHLTGEAVSGLVAFPGAPFLGGGLIALALANDAWCAATFARSRTTVLPHRAASHLATDGPYRFSRNPIYISHLTVVVGVGLLISSAFTLLLTPLLAVALQKFSIEPEERHLLAKFGEDYRAYMARTRRWL